MPVTPVADLTVVRIRRAVLALMLAFALGGALVPIAGSAAAAQDSDGDGIPDALDPDDDNDGTLDNPHSGGPAAGDEDGDTIPDALDPDDDNDAVFDRDEPGASSPPPASGGTSGTGGRSGSDPPAVLALPVTGSGAAAGAGSRSLAYLAVIGCLAVASTAAWSPGRDPRRHGPHHGGARP